MNFPGALQIIVITLFDIYIMIVLARFLLQLVRADFYNPVSQFIVKATSPVLNPLRRIIPGAGRFDVPAIIFMLVLVVVKICIFLLLGSYALIPTQIGILSIMSAANTIINFYVFAIFVSIILSWVAQGARNPMADLLLQLTDPIMAPARKILPPMGGLDFSPILVLLLLSAIKVLFKLNGIP